MEKGANVPGLLRNQNDNHKTRSKSNLFCNDKVFRKYVVPSDC